MGLFVGPWVFSEDPFVWEKNVAGLLVGSFKVHTTIFIYNVGSIHA